MTTYLNADFQQSVVIRPDDYKWVDSPMAGVTRMMLDRIGDEVARATSIVAYEPFSAFSPHIHSGGEEFLVLAGVFADEHHDYPQGSYARNPIGTSHTPKISKEGATILVKLHQFDTADTEQKVIDSNQSIWQTTNTEGLAVIPLHEFKSENVRLEKWEANTHVKQNPIVGGEEIFVLDGVLHDENGSYPKGTWLRNPHLSQCTRFTKNKGAQIYVKTGHLGE